MKTFDEIICKTMALLASYEPRIYLYNKEKVAAIGKKNELILSREAAFELGEGALSSVSYTAITDNEELVSGDRILLFGKDLQELTENSPFARVTILLTDDIEENGDEGAYAVIKNIEIKKYNVSPSGYMMRASALSNREQVRVSKRALKAGLNFECVGNMFISEYKENKHVKAVTVIFVTLPDAPYAELERLAEGSVGLTRALNHIFTEINMDCRACEWKPVCDEVEGMKEMHSNIAKR
ncbi:MAG: carbon monoxide dehydrogenase [Firmicutes bacterium HGW-Firmicutes-16]|nr:MAG: carbon monoxide dehydrogenase [Firmicutes bacterium HGW-Firmicutes-16]